MAVSLVSTGVQFPDNSIQTTAAAASGSITATASGAIAAGDEIVVNSSGTVSKVAGQVYTLGSSYQYASSIGTSRTVYDSVGARVITVYFTSSGNFNVVVGTVSGTVITWGSPVQVTSRSVGNNVSIAWNSTAGLLVVAWQESSSICYAVAGTLSGSTWSFGSPVSVQTYGQNNTGLAYHPGADRFVFVTNNFDSPSYPIARVLSVSGTTITVNAFVNITTSYNTFNGGLGGQVVYDPASGNVVWVAREGNGGTLIVAAGSVSSTSTSWGAASSTGVNSQVYFLGYEPISQKCLLTWTANSTGYPWATVVTVSGTSASLGTAVRIAPTGNPVYSSFSFTSDTAAGKIYFLGIGPSNYPYYILGAISGTTSSWETPQVIVSAASRSNPFPVYNTSTGGVVNTLTDGSTGNANGTGFIVLVPYTNLTATNFIGFSGAAYSNGATATVQTIGSSNANQSSLTPGLQYYVLGSGTLSTTPGTPSVFGGTAVSATRILIKG